MATTPNGSSPRVVTAADNTRILCVADIRGHLSSLNDLAKMHKASFIIHTGDFGFYDRDSVPKITDKTLRHVAQYSPLLDARTLPQDSQSLRQFLLSRPISQLHQFLSGEAKLDIPVYTVHGACEDVSVLEKFRSGEYKVPNLHIVDEHSSQSIETDYGVKFRLLGLGGAIVMHKLFDNGSGRTTIAGGGGTTWTTLLQIGELIDTAARVFDETETRILITHASPAREGILAQLALALKADFSISGGLHFRYGCSYNEFAVNPTYDYFRGKLAGARAQFMDVWEMVKGEVMPVISTNNTQKQLLDNALSVIERMPTSAQGGTDREKEKEELSNLGFRNMWHFNLADASYGSLVLEVSDGKISVETRSEGFNFKYRRANSSSGNAGGKGTKPSLQAPRKSPSSSNGGAPPPAQSSAASPAASSQKAEVVIKDESGVSKTETGTESSGAKEGGRASDDKSKDDGDKSSSTNSFVSGTKPLLGNTVAMDLNLSDERDSSGVAREPRRPGLWVARADESEEAMKTHFALEDQKNITSIMIRTAQSGKKFAYVFFDTQENAQNALGRVDQEKLGRVTPINDSAARGGRAFGGPGRGSGAWSGRGIELDGGHGRRDIHRLRISGGSRTVARARSVAARGRGGPPFSMPSDGPSGSESGTGPGVHNSSSPTGGSDGASKPSSEDSSAPAS
ncbi:hypothetical protein V1511DRAFT_485807 [Dipodascopsis uninucleata]